MSLSSTSSIICWLEQRTIGNINLILHAPTDSSKKLNTERVLRARPSNSEWKYLQCLVWNKTGNLLASGDKFGAVDIWSPFLDENSRQSIETWGGTIREVEFLYGHDDRLIVTCSALRLNVMDLVKRSPLIDCQVSGPHCLMTHQDEPNLIWFCNYNRIEQIDIREPDTHTNVILDLEDYYICSAINPYSSEILAVGTKGFIKLFDRRFINGRDPDLSHSTNFVPNHPNCERTAAEDLTFSRDGSELLASYSYGDVYLFNIYDSLAQSKLFETPIRKGVEDYEYLKNPIFFGNNEEFVLTRLKNQLHLFEKVTSNLIDIISDKNIDFSTLKLHPSALVMAAIRDQDKIVILSPVDANNKNSKLLNFEP